MCGIYDSGELSVVEYGSSEVLGSWRVTRVSHYILSISLQSHLRPKACIVAHLEGKRNIKVTELVSGATLASFEHAAKVDWLVSSITPSPMRSSSTAPYFCS